jgi:hypothetical protein
MERANTKQNKNQIDSMKRSKREKRVELDAKREKKRQRVSGSNFDADELVDTWLTSMFNKSENGAAKKEQWDRALQEVGARSQFETRHPRLGLGASESALRLFEQASQQEDAVERKLKRQLERQRAESGRSFGVIVDDDEEHDRDVQDGDDAKGRGGKKRVLKKRHSPLEALLAKNQAPALSGEQLEALERKRERRRRTRKRRAERKAKEASQM